LRLLSELCGKTFKIQNPKLNNIEIEVPKQQPSEENSLSQIFGKKEIIDERLFLHLAKILRLYEKHLHLR